MEPFIQLHPDDNVVIVLQHLEKGSLIKWHQRKIKLDASIDFGHKIAIKPIEKGAKILKYGLPIGNATKTIMAGDHVHVQNLESDYAINDIKRQN